MLDQELKFDMRDLELEHKLHSKDFSVFNRVTVGNNAHVLKSGDEIKITVKRRLIFARIVYFKITPRLPREEVSKYILHMTLIL